MNKQWTFVAVAAVGVVAVASWSVAQTPKNSPATKSPLSSTTADDSSPGDILPKTKLPGSTLKSSGSSLTPLSSGNSKLGGRSSSGSSLSGTTTKTTSGTTTSGTTGAASRTTSSSSLPDIDSSLAPFRGSSSSRSESLPGSSSSSATSIRIEHALVTSLDPIKLPARDAGAIRDITVRKGDEVKVDDILGQLDDKDSQTKRKIAELERDAARIQAESTAQIDAAKKGEEVTKENLKANEELVKKSPGALSPFDMRRAKFEWERALAQIAVAEVEKAVAEATQLAKEGQIEGAMIEIERRKIVAPIDGVVNEVYKHKGEWCQPGDPVLELVRMDRLEIEGFVFAADASPSKVRGKAVDVVVQVAGGDAYKASGTITFASPVLEGSGRIRQFRVSTEIDNKKVPDEKGELQWLIQPGTEAEMIIHHNPAPPKPVIAPKTTSPAGAKTGVPGAKVEAFKPALPGTGAKSDAKADAKTDSKTNPKSDAKTGAKSETKSSAKEDARSETKGEKAAADAKNSTKADDSTKKNSKEPTKSSKIKL